MKKQLALLIYLFSYSLFGQLNGEKFKIQDAFELTKRNLSTHNTKIKHPSFEDVELFPDNIGSEMKLRYTYNPDSIIKPIEINTGNVGRVIFYSRFYPEDEVEDTGINPYKTIGFLKVDFISVDSLGNEVIKRTETQDFNNYRVKQFHYLNQKNPKINRVRLSITPIEPNLNYELAKLKVIELSDEGIEDYLEDIARNKIIDSSNNPDSIKVNLIESYARVIKDISTKNTMLNRVKVGADAAKTSETLAYVNNPFTYNDFRIFFQGILSKASEAEQSRIDKLIDESNSPKTWFNSLGSLANILTGGVFNEVVGVLRNVIDSGINVTYDGKEYDIFRLGNSFARVKGNGVKIVDDKDIIKEFLELENKYKEYLDFINLLNTKMINSAIIHRDNIGSFNKLKELDKKLKAIFEKILKSVDSQASVDDFIDNDTYDQIKANQFLKTKLNINESNISKHKLEHNEILRNQELIHLDYSHTADRIKNYYDDKYSYKLNYVDSTKFKDPIIIKVINEMNIKAKNIDDEYNLKKEDEEKKMKVYQHNFKKALNSFTGKPNIVSSE